MDYKVTRNSRHLFIILWGAWEPGGAVWPLPSTKRSPHHGPTAQTNLHIQVPPHQHCTNHCFVYREPDQIRIHLRIKIINYRVFLKLHSVHNYPVGRVGGAAPKQLFWLEPEPNFIIGSCYRILLKRKLKSVFQIRISFYPDPAFSSIRIQLFSSIWIRIQVVLNMDPIRIWIQIGSENKKICNKIRFCFYFSYYVGANRTILMLISQLTRTLKEKEMRIL